MHDPAQWVRASRALYAKSFSAHGDALGSLLWGSEDAQRLRFAKLMLLGDLRGATLLDVGCGFADLYPVACQAGVGAYTGLELLGDIAGIARRKHPQAEILEGSLETLEQSRRFDFVVLSGVFNSGKPSFVTVEGTLRAMYARCLRGMAANFLSRYATGAFNVEGTYYEPSDMVRLAGQLSRRFSLAHDYRDNDFTLYVWRDAAHPGLEQLPGSIDDSGIARQGQGIG